MDRQYYDNSEIEIDLIDLCKVFLANIKWIILAGVIGLAAALGYVAAKPVPAAVSASQKMEELQKTENPDEQKALLKQTGELISDVIGNNLSTTESETQVELNFAVVKIKHTIKRSK